MLGMNNKNNENEARFALIAELADLCCRNHCSIKYRTEDFTIEINHSHESALHMMHGSEVNTQVNTQKKEVLSKQSESATSINHPQVKQSGVVVKSDLVGTVYLSPSPGQNSFVKIGSHVSKGDTVCIIDCMKVMNPIPATHTGEIIHVHIGNEEIVEFGQPLFTIKEAKN